MATLFSRIIAGELPAAVLYEDELCMVILDIAPVNKGHALVISREEYETTQECPGEVLAHLMAVANRVAKRLEQELDIDGYNLLINNRSASGQEVPHLHVHVIPRYEGDGKTPVFSKEHYQEGEMERIARSLRLSR